MNRLLTGILLSTALLFTQSCSQRVDSEQVHTHDPHAGHSTHEQHHHSGTKLKTIETAQAKLIVPNKITLNQPVSLVINIQDKSGQPIADFEPFQTKLMHLIVVSDNLQFFDHLHPEYKGNGSFEITTNLPKSGKYTLFSDYKPSGKTEQVSSLKLEVPGGKPSTSEKVDFQQTKTFANTKVNFKPSQSILKANQEVHLSFNLTDASNNQPISNLQPYLGERGHLVILKQSPSLTSKDYIHAHAIKGTPANEVHFVTQFPQPGKYKLWGQFNRNGKIITADFWLNVL